MLTTQHDAAVYRHLALSLAHQGALDDAEAAARLSVTLDASSAESWKLLGTVRARRGDHRGAAKAYEEALTRAPADISTWSDLGEVCVSLLAFADATRAFKRVLELDPDAAHPSGRRARMVIAKTIKSLQQK